MESLSEYKNPIMSTGLIPVIACMIFCIFFQDAAVLYACSWVGILYILYRLVKYSVYQPNPILLHGTLALIIVSVIKGISGDMLVPDRAVPITLEILILSFSLFYLMAPDFYTKLFSRFHYKTSILNYWAVRIITVLSGIHLFTSCIICLFFSPLSYNTLYVITHIVPPLVYVTCIIVNHAFVKAVGRSFKKLPSLRIAPVCNGKIYVAPRYDQKEEPGKLDLPMEDYIYNKKTDTDQYAKEIKNKYSDNITDCPDPRFSLKYPAKESCGINKAIVLYVLPLRDENQIHFTGGRFVTPEEIEMQPAHYSSYLKEEAIHLNMVAQTWKEFQ